MTFFSKYVIIRIEKQIEPCSSLEIVENLGGGGSFYVYINYVLFAAPGERMRADFFVDNANFRAIELFFGCVLPRESRGERTRDRLSAGGFVLRQHNEQAKSGA